MSPPSCGRVFKGNIWGRAAGYMTFFWLVGGEVTGWNSRNANHQPSGSNQSGVSACTDCYHLLPGWWPCCCQVASVVSNSVQPHRQQPTRLSHTWDSPGKKLEWVAMSFSNAWKWKVKVKSPSSVRLFTAPWTAAYQAPPSMGFSRQEYWSGVPLPSLRTWILKLRIQGWKLQGIHETPLIFWNSWVLRDT